VGTILLTIVVVTIAIHALKLTVGEWTPRPTGTPGGFPSGHAATAFALAFMLSRRYTRLWALWFAMAVAISWSRVCIHSHYIYQVAGGMVLGLETAVFLDRRCRPDSACVTSPADETDTEPQPVRRV
jgi:membrane-associated phospholipid phosphatase